MNRFQFEVAQPIINRLTDNGYEAYFVGGSVRDYIMNRSIHDVDITTSATPDEIESLFEHTIPIGKDHGTINIVWNKENYEVTTFRAEGTYVEHRRPSEVYFVRDLYRDVERRDFTMNAIAMDTSFQRYDYFDGEQDIQQRLIRTVGDAETRFNEDALRILRAVRFKSQLGFHIESQTYDAMQKRLSDIQFLSIERITAELTKLLNGTFVAETFPLLQALNIWQYIPFFKDMNMSSLKIVTPLTLEAFLALILLNNGEASLKSLKLSKVQNQLVSTMIKAINTSQSIETKNALKLFVYDFGLDLSLELLRLMEIWQANQISLPSPLIYNEGTLRTVWDELPIKDRQSMAINGAILMNALHLKGGPWLKKALREVECAIIKGQLGNQQEEIIEWVKEHVEIS